MSQTTPWEPDDAARADKLAFYLLKSVSKAIRRYRMLDSGDKVLLAVSGGKDSMTLLDLMVRRRGIAPEAHQIEVALVRSDASCGRQVPEDWLRTWCHDRDIAFHTTEIHVAQELAALESNTCFRCSWHRRKALFRLTQELGFNKLALGHHADDIIETALLNLFFAGQVNRMEPKISFFEGQFQLIRPLCLIEERDIIPFVRANGYPIQGEPCPAEEGSRRTLMRQIVRQLDNESHDVRRCIYGALERNHRDIVRARSSEATRQDSAPCAPVQGEQYG